MNLTFLGVGGLPRQFWILWVGTLANRVGFFVLPFMAMFLAHQGFPPKTVGIVVSCYGGGTLGSQVLGGYLADRFGRRFTLVTGMIGTAFSVILLMLAPNLLLIAMAAAMVGLTADLYRPAVSAMVADLVPAENRARAFGLLYWAINLGMGAAGLLGGALAQRNYEILFVADALTCLLFAALIARHVPDSRPERSERKSGGYREALRDRLLMGLAAVGLINTFIYLQQLTTLPLAIVADGLGPASYGVIWAVNPISIIVLQPLMLRFMTARSTVAACAVGLVVQGVGFGLTAYADTVLAYAATVVIWTIGEVIFNSAFPALTADITPAGLRGRYNGVIGFGAGVAALLAPICGTAAVTAFGKNIVWAMCFILGLIGCAAMIGTRRAVAIRSDCLNPFGKPVVDR
ncbi:MDR family MFS transporter [Streptomyces olivoreticuli]|uniref:MDR family MFS transporter n=1 Tax=Streptomyces olivoreticuli TaxID=68246 RepID=UPI000E238A2F|nr:MFS transporter [Streptomyces olivoreticuli]